MEIEKEDWAHKMQRLLRRACHATNLAREQGVLLTPGPIAPSIERSYDAILAAGLEFHEAQPALVQRPGAAVAQARRRVGHNLLVPASEHRKSDVRCAS